MCIYCDSIQKSVILKKDIRGKNFIKAMTKLSNLMDDYWEIWLKKVLKDLDNRLLKDKLDDFQSLFDEFEINLEEILSYSYILGMKFSDKDIKRQIDGKLFIDVSFDINDDYAKNYVQQRIWFLIKWIDETTRKEVESIISNWVKNSLSRKEIAEDISTKFSQFKTYRSILIAQMEVTNAFSEWKEKQFQKYVDQFWVPGWKSVKTQWDDKVRPEHSKNEKAWWINFNLEFPWDTKLNKMKEPFDFNCRCVTKYSMFNPDSESVW